MGEVQAMPAPEEPRRDTMMAMLERVLMSPDVPIERLERLLELQNQERQRQAKIVWSERMAACQSDMKAVLKNKHNSQTRSNYATYDALNEVAQPVYTAHGFSVTYDTEDAGKSDTIRVLAFVENGGYERVYHVDMPCDGKGAKGNDVMTKTHAFKSAVTYGKGTLLPMIFNLSVSDKADDDGNGAAQDQPVISENQEMELRDLLMSLDLDEAKFCQRIKVESLSAIFLSKFEDAKRLILSTGARK